MPPLLRLHHDASITRLELTSTDGFPRLTTSLLQELEDVFAELLSDSSCHALILHGSGKAFAAGAEIAEVGALTGVAALDFSRSAQLFFEKLAHSPKPIVAAIQGYCLGGGFDLALACHWRLATPDAVFGHPGPTLGLLTGWGGTQRLPRLVGRARALELLLTGESVTAEKALAIGLVNEVVPAEQLVRAAVERARGLASRRQASGPS